MTAVAVAIEDVGAARTAAPELAAVLSPSQVFTFQQCSARWWFKYGLGLPDPPTANLALGKAVHEALRFNFAQKIKTRTDLPRDQVVAAFDVAWARESADACFRDEDNPDAIGAQGEDLVAKYQAEAAPAVQPAAVELEVQGLIGGVRVQGRIDLLDAQRRVVDFKTASKRPSGFQDNAFQLTTYVQLLPEASGEVRIDTMVKTKSAQIVQMTRTLGEEDYLATNRLYPLAQEAMRSGYYVPNRYSTLCSRKNCPFWRACQDEFGGRVEET